MEKFLRILLALGFLVTTVASGFAMAPAAVADGTTWTSQSSIPSARWRSVTFGNGLFVAVSHADLGAVSLVMTSPDGITWTPRTPPDKSWGSVTFGNGLFVAVSDGTDGVMTSPDGITWTTQTITQNKYWGSVTYGNGKFVAVAFSGAGTTNVVMTSSDGATWTTSPTVSVPYQEWYSVTYGVVGGSGLFVAVAGGGMPNPRVMTSPDGVTWTAQTQPAAQATTWSSVAYGNGQFVAVSTNAVMTSPDGVTWTAQTPAANNAWSWVTYGNGLFVAVSRTGTTNGVMTSSDGISWVSRTTPNNQWFSVTYANGLFVAVAGSGTGNRVMTSGLFTAASTSTLPTVTTAPMQAYGRDANGTCINNAPSWVNWPGIVDKQYDGWVAGWQQWPNNGRGGFVCMRQPTFTAEGTWSVI